MDTQQTGPREPRTRPPGTREKIRAVLPALLCDVVLPYAVFFALSQAGMATVWALAAGGVVPALRAVHGYVRTRRADAVALCIVVLFVLGIVLSLVTGDPRFALAKEAGLTGLVGVLCFGSLFVGRPLMFYVRRELWPENTDQWEEMWRSPAVRRNLVLTTATWGVGLIVESAVAIAAVYSLPTSRAAAVSLALNAGAITVLVAVTHLMGHRLRKKANAIAWTG